MRRTLTTHLISSWCTHSDVALDTTTSTLSFRTIHLAPLAVVVPRTKLLPYTSWNVRPTGGRNGSSVAITLYVGLADPIVFEVSLTALSLRVTLTYHELVVEICSQLTFPQANTVLMSDFLHRPCKWCLPQQLLS